MADDSRHRPKGEPAKAKALELPMASWVKGGTTSARHDESIARQHADANRRRSEEDHRRVLAKRHPADDVQNVLRTGTSARQREITLGGAGHALVVLGVKHPKDNRILEWQVCELVLPMGESEKEMTLCMVCMRCIFTLNRSAQEAQTKIQNSHRAFSLDQRTREQRKPSELLGFCAGDVWINPKDANEVVTVAGMITTHGWQKCDAVGCGWDFMIDDSVVYSR